MTRRRRSAPVSVLRERLNKRLSEQQTRKQKTVTPASEDENRKKFFFASFSLGFMRSMNRYFYLKMAVALTLVLMLGISKQMGWSWAGKILESASYVVTWDMDMQYLQDRVVPVVQDIGADGIIDRISFLNLNREESTFLPVNGTLKSGFGLRKNPLTGKEEMHYGIDIISEKGSLVRAILPGEILAVEEAETGKRLIIRHKNGWSSVYEGVEDVRVDTGDEVSLSQVLGILGKQSTWDVPHLHFELRWNGSPTDPLTLLGDNFEPENQGGSRG